LSSFDHSPLRFQVSSHRKPDGNYRLTIVVRVILNPFVWRVTSQVKPKFLIVKQFLWKFTNRGLDGNWLLNIQVMKVRI